VLTVRLAAAALGFESLVLVPVAFLRLRHRSGTFVTVNAVKLVLQVVFNLIFIIPLGMGVNGVVLSGLLASLMIGAWLSAYLLRETGFGFSRQAARDLFRFGAPLMGLRRGDLRAGVPVRHAARDARVPAVQPGVGPHPIRARAA
jgi:Na+-driven multidrug efflux pump